MDGFYWIRHKEYGSVPIAVLMVILFSISFSLNRLCASFVVNETDPRSVNSLTGLAGVLALFLLVCVVMGLHLRRWAMYLPHCSAGL